jgi:hypothetical protein
MNSGAAKSQSLTEDTVLRRVQGAMSYKFWTGLEVSTGVNANL